LSVGGDGRSWQAGLPIDRRAVVIIVPLTVWLTVTVLDRLFVLTDPYDPLTKVGGLKPQQEVIHEK
jgi:hypothetical protein